MPRRQGENRVKVYIEIYRARFLTDNAGRSPFSASKCGGKSLYSEIKNLGWFLPEHQWRMKRVLKGASMIALTRLSTDNAGRSPFSAPNKNMHFIYISLLLTVERVRSLRLLQEPVRREITVLSDQKPWMVFAGA